jgi:alpha-glucosidase
MQSSNSTGRHWLAFSTVLLLALPAAAATYDVASPDGRNVVRITHDTAGGTLAYAVTRDGATVLESAALGLVTSRGDFTRGLAFLGRADAVAKGRYSLPGHKKSTYGERANETTLRFTRGGNEFDLVLRAFNDGIAWRYAIPGSGSISVQAEHGGFDLPDGTGGWAQTFVTSYEGRYKPVANFNAGSFGMPVLVHGATDWLLLAESDVGSNDYASHLTGASGNLLQLAPPDANAATAALPYQGPWRLAMIGGLDAIVASTLVEDLSAPAQVADVSWIAPGRASWSWMTGEDQADYATHAAFVDGAALMGWEYTLVDAGWQESWVPALVDYARPKNVGIILWTSVDDVATETQARATFSKWAGWGVRGAKVDYFYDDGEASMQRYEMLARVAADYKLFIYFHGATKPNGLHRKWPNILTQEGVAGAEQRSMPASHDVSLVFTRNAIGPMDYTPVDYSGIQDGNSTWGHQTALAVMFSSYIVNYSDHWASYRDSLAAGLLRALPATWDETRLLEGAPDQYATIARRSGSEWFVGAITGSGLARTASVALDFLPAGATYTALIWRDGASAHDLAYETRSVTRASVLTLPIAANGGAAVRLTTQAPSSALPNLAAGKAASADSSCTPQESPNKAANGSMADRWCSSGASKWLQVDLGAVYTLSSFTLRHAGAGGAPAAQDTRDFAIQLGTDGVHWSTPVNVSGNTADVTTHAIAPTDARYVRVNVINGAQPGKPNVARLYELEAYGQGAYDTNAFYKIVNRNSGKVLAVQNAALGDVAPVVQWDYVDATTNDEWRLVDAGNGAFDIVNHYSGKALDLKGALADDGTPLVQYASHGASNQQWQLVPTDGGYVRLVSAATGKVADVTQRSLDNGAAVIEFPWNGQSNQQWQLVRLATVPQVLGGGSQLR